MDFSPTDEQAEVIAAVAKRSGSVMVEAGAGCAKTSTVKMASRGIKVPALGLAFNKRIADDLQAAVPSNVQVKTMNGLGHGAWARGPVSGQKIVLDDRKLAKIITETMKDRRVKHDEDLWDSVRQLVRSAMQAGLVPAGTGPEGLVADDDQGWADCGEAAGLSLGEFAESRDLAKEVLRKNIALAKTGLISFDDQIYCSTMLGGRFTQFPVVIVDEDQDLSPLNIRMLGQSLAPGGRIIAVGDKRQAIYAWRGAAGDSAERIRRLSQSDWTDLPLMTTFRCPKIVVERQQWHVPGFRAWAGAQAGAFGKWAAPERGQWHGWGWQEIAGALPSPRASLAILCRNNAPLVQMAFRLIKEGIGPRMLGRDIGKGLEKLLHTVSGGDSGASIGAIVGGIETWRQRELLAARGASEAKLDGIHDRADCLLAVAQAEGLRTAADVTGRIREIFAEKESQVTLSSIHRAKGLEWDMVVHLDPDRVPSKWARRAEKEGNPVPLEQEWNLKYVAETRTRHTLVEAWADDWRAGK